MSNFRLLPAAPFSAALRLGRLPRHPHTTREVVSVLNAKCTAFGASRLFRFPVFSLLLLAMLAGLAPHQAQAGIGDALALRASLSAAHVQASAPADSPLGYSHLTNGRTIINRQLLKAGALRRANATGTANTVPIPNATQTVDTANPPPAFEPLIGYGTPAALTNNSASSAVYINNLTPTNLTPVWSDDQTFIVFSSNRTKLGGVQPDGRFHIWAMSASGGEAFQVTTDSDPNPNIRGEFFPALSPGSGRLAFVSDAQSPGTRMTGGQTAGVRNLYVIGASVAGSAPSSASFSYNMLIAYNNSRPYVDVSQGNPALPLGQPMGITSVTLRGVDAAGFPNTGFTQVQRPTFSPGNPGLIAFSAFSVRGSNAGHYHLYFLNTNTGGFDPTNISYPGKLTDGLADDTDPAWSQDGQFIAFASTASRVDTKTTNNSFGPSAPGDEQDQDQSQSQTAVTGTTTFNSNRSLFLISGGSNGTSSGFGAVPSTVPGGRITAAGTDNFGPAWSYATLPFRNQYTNPAPGFEYLAFARGTSQAARHDIYYLQTVRATDGGSESDRSNEAGTTPVPINTPVYQINAGDTNAFQTFGNYAADTSRLFNGGTGLFSGGTANAAPQTATFNLTNDPGTPAGIYQTNRQGTFTYTLPNLTPSATYTVRLHFAEVVQADTATGKRVFSVTANNQTVLNNFDISAQAGTANGSLAGLVSDAQGNPLTGATVTITQNGAVTTVPTGASTSPAAPTGDGTPQNYAASLAAGTATVTVTAPGFGQQTQTTNVLSNSFVRVNFALVSSANPGTLTGTVSDANRGVNTIPVVVTIPNTNEIVQRTTTAAGANPGRYTFSLPAGTYNVTAFGGVGIDATLTQSVTVTAGAATTQNFLLASGNNIGTLGGLITDAQGNPLTGATVKINGPGGYVAVVRTTAVSSPNTPNGNGTPQNFVLSLPGGSANTPQSYRFTPALTGYGPSPNNNSNVINGAYVQDATLVLPPTGGGATAAFPAVVQSFQVQPDANGTITLGFNPVAGDPPIVEGVEVLADTAPATSSGFGGATASNPASTAPQNLTAIGGDGMVTLSFSPAVSQSATGIPSNATFYRIFRSPASITTVNSPGTGAGLEGTVSYMDGVTPTPDPNNRNRLIYVDTNVTNGSEYFYQITALFQQFITPEGDTAATNTPNAVIKLNTDDNTPATLGGTYDDVYPTWSPFASVFSIAYQSGNFAGNTLTNGGYLLNANGTLAAGTVLGGRTVTYNNPVDTTPAEVAISIPNGGSANTSDPNNPSYTVGGNYSGIFESQVLNLDPPTLLRFAPDQVIHVQAAGTINTATGQSLDPVSGTANKLAVVGNQNISFTVRLSDREAGIDNTGGPALGTGNLAATAANNPKVFLQIKDPDSKYQDSQNSGGGLEHKVFARDKFFIGQPNQSSLNELNSGTANKGLGLAFGGYEVGPNTTVGAPFDYPSYIQGGPGVTYVGSTTGGAAPRGAHGGRWAANANNLNGTFIYVGKGGGGTNPYPNPINPSQPNPGGDPALFIPTGPEYEAQLINPKFATTPGGSGTDASANDYRSPYYLAGIDDQLAFSGAANPPRPTANVTGTNGTNQPAEYLQMIKSPVQDNKGGVLYTVTWKTPASVSDFYLDVIAYDKAVFPALPPGTSTYAGGKFNWRIYDNVGGFSTQRTLANSDILFVSDYALGQKFAATTFGGQNVNANLIPKQFGTESYLTDVDVNILPDRVYAGIPTDSTHYIFNPALNPFFNSPEGSQRSPRTNGSANAVRSQNSLGVGSYFDSVIDDNGRSNGVPNVSSQKYTIWRILSRGPVPDTLLQSYQPTPVNQPAVNDAPNATAAPATILDAHRCVVWLSPYTGSLFIDPGTLDDLDLTGVPNVVNRVRTQTALRNFVQNGGRLFVTGQDVGVTLTQRGTASLNTTGAFLPDVLNAAFATDGGGSTTLTATNNRIFGNPLFDGSVNGTNGGLTYLTLGGDILGGFFLQNPPAFPYTDNLLLSSPQRDDGAFSQIPAVTLPGGASIQGQRDTITPLNGAQIGASYDNGSTALVFHDDPYVSTGTHALPNGGTGSRTVYAAFGLEALSNDYFSSDAPNPSNAAPLFPDLYIPDVIPRNTRAAVMHNIVSYLRTGSITGRITQTAAGNGQNVGDGVPNATVYVRSSSGQAPSSRSVFSATTLSDGSFTIFGVEPGTYKLVAYKVGYTRATSNSNISTTVEGDTTATQSLTINPIPTGSIAGSVSDDLKAPVPLATVTVTSQDNTVTLSTQTFAGTQTGQTKGNFLLSNVPVATYTTAIANGPLNNQGLPQYTTAKAPNPTYDTGIPVQSSVTTGDGAAGGPPVTFTLTRIGAQIMGRVYSGTDNAAGGALVQGGAVQAFASAADAASSTGTVLAKAVIGADGTYTLSGILPVAAYPGPPTQIVIKVSAPGFTPVTFTQAFYLGGQLTGGDVALTAIPPGSLSGHVTYTSSGVAANATVTFTPASGTGALSATTNANGDYSIAVVPSGDYSATAVGQPNPHGKPTAAATTATPITVVSNQNKNVPFQLALIPPTYSGTIQTSNGTPLLHAAITVTDNATGSIIGTTFTDAKGAFTTQNTVPLVNGGNYTIVASLAGYASVTAQNPFVAGSTNTKNTFYYGDTVVNQVFVLNALLPGTVSGTVTDNTGAVVPGATVTLTSTDKTITRTAVTDASGVYAIAMGAVPAGDYDAAVTGPLNSSGKQEYQSPAPQRVTVSPSATKVQNLTLTQILPTISVTVTDAVSRQPVTTATVTFTPTAGGTASTVTANAAGVYTSPGLAPGQYTVTASAAGFFDGSVTATEELGDVTPLALALSQKATVYGLVTDSSTGAALPGVTLTFTDANTGLGTATVPAAITTGANPAAGPDGKLQNFVASLPPGKYIITATKASYTQAISAPFTVTNAAAVRVPTLALTSSIGTLYGLVTDAISGSTTPVGGVTVSVVNTATSTQAASFTTSATAATGVAGTDQAALNYSGLVPAGMYTVTVTQGTRKSVSQPVTVVGGQSKRLDFSGTTYGLPALYVFTPGLKFFSTPYDYSGIGFDGLLGTINSAAGGTDPNGNRSHVAVWDPTASLYRLDPAAPADTVRLGQGYWVFLKNSVPITQQGTAAPSGFVAQTLNPTWNMIGVPNPNGVPVSSLMFDNGRGGMITYADASSSQYAILTPNVTNIYRYETTTNTYQPVSNGEKLNPWQAYWIRVRVPATLEIPTAPAATGTTGTGTGTGIPGIP